MLLHKIFYEPITGFAFEPHCPGTMKDCTMYKKTYNLSMKREARITD